MYLQQRNHFSASDLFSQNSLKQFRCSVEQSHSNLTMLLFRSLLPLFSTFFWEHWARVGFRGGEREMVNSVPSSFLTQRAPFESFAPSLYLFFHSQTDYLNWPKQISHFGHNVRNHRLVNTVSASLMPLRDIWPKDLSEKYRCLHCYVKKLMHSRVTFNKIRSKSYAFQN